MYITSRQPAGLMLLLAACALSSGCVQRRLTINSNPPGALVRVDDEDIGVTPVSTNFVYYGTRKIQLIKPGFETLTVLQRIKAPWYELPGIDFFSEHFSPTEIRDERNLYYELKPAAIVPNDQLLQRADNLRRSARAGGIELPRQQPVPGSALPIPSP
ncbi:MAG: PEGA domain-containing protein [Pirellulales bacterium]